MQVCKICSLHTNPNLVILQNFEHWIVREAEKEKDCKGYLYIEPKRHVESYIEISSQMWKELAFVYEFAFNWIYQNYSPLKVYQVSISEAVKHIHIHLVPRYQEEVKGLDYLNLVVTGKWKS